MMGIEMVHEQCGPLFSKVAFDQGLLSVYANNNSRVAQLLPPLIIDRALALDIIDRVDRSLQVIKTIFGGGLIGCLIARLISLCSPIVPNRV